MQNNSYRHYLIGIWFLNILFGKKKLEPVGSVAPNVNIGDKTNIATVRIGNSCNILCPAQAYPMPAFRWAIFSTTTAVLSQLTWTSKLLNGAAKTYSHVMWYRISNRSAVACVVIRLLCRVNAIPTFSFISMCQSLVWVLQCASSCIFIHSNDLHYAEPVGSVSPKINSYSKNELFVGIHTAVNIMCPAQSFPVPVFR